MRWIWGLVIACLVAATGVRPIELTPRTSDEVAKLVRSPAALPVMAGRRTSSHDPKLHLPLAVLADVPALAVPKQSVLVALRDAHASSHAIWISSRSSRGPPVS